MNFTLVTSRDDSKAAFEKFRERMTKGCEEFQKRLGYPGGYLERAVLAQLGIRVLRYAMDGNKPVFKNLDEVLR